MKALCQLCSKVLCTRNSLKHLVVEAVAGGEPVSSLGDCQLVTNGGGFFLACFFGFFLREGGIVEISSRTQNPLFMPGTIHSGSAS